MNNTPDKLRLLLQQARRAKGLSQERLGNLVMMDRNKISAIETGKKGNLVWEDLVKIANALDISETKIAQIMSGTSDKDQHGEIMDFLQEIYNILCEILDQLTDD